MAMIEAFELRRRVDGLVYRFDRATAPSGAPGYKRSDGDLWIVWSGDWGWASFAAEDDGLTGHAWETPPAQQGDSPPEGVWVTRKGDKSYVYDLVHL